MARWGCTSPSIRSRSICEHPEPKVEDRSAGGENLAKAELIGQQAGETTTITARLSEPKVVFVRACSPSGVRA